MRCKMYNFIWRKFISGVHSCTILYCSSDTETHGQVATDIMLQRARGCAFPLLICLAVAAMVGMGLLYSFRRAASTLSETNSVVVHDQQMEPSKRTKSSTERQPLPDTDQNSGAGSRHGSCSHDMVHALGSITNSLYPACSSGKLLQSGGRQQDWSDQNKETLNPLEISSHRRAVLC